MTLDESVTTYLQCGNAYNDKLATVGKPIDSLDFNHYLFKGLYAELKVFVTTVSFVELHFLLLRSKFIYNNTFYHIFIQ
jgi:hypothetical protein